MKPPQLRLKLLRLLTKELGVYSNGIPSIWVYGSGKKPPSSSDGLEVLIKNVPGGAAQSSSGGVKYKPQIWEITLKNFKEDQMLLRAIRKIEKNFIVRNYNHIALDEESIEQARVFIFDPIGI